MIKTSKVNAYGEVKTVDTLLPAVQAVNADKSSKVNVHFGSNMYIIVVVAKDAQLSKDNLERIRILTEVKQ
ncbi:MAG: hypothetical protein PHW28_06810 [Mesotoga sp.]|nr:hypothetical protein [Mesotoga sp.]